jgi:hypothetical protein
MDLQKHSVFPSAELAVGAGADDRATAFCASWLHAQERSLAFVRELTVRSALTTSNI